MAMAFLLSPQVRTPTASQRGAPVTPVLSRSFSFASSPSLRGMVPVTPVLPRQGAYASPVPQHNETRAPEVGIATILDSLEGICICIQSSSLHACTWRRLSKARHGNQLKPPCISYAKSITVAIISCRIDTVQ